MSRLVTFPSVVGKEDESLSSVLLLPVFPPTHIHNINDSMQRSSQYPAHRWGCALSMKSNRWLSTATRGQSSRASFRVCPGDGHTIILHSPSPSSSARFPNPITSPRSHHRKDDNGFELPRAIQSAPLLCVSARVCVCFCVRVCTLYHSFKPLPPPASHLPCMHYLQFSFPASSSTAIPPCVCASSRSWRKSCGKTCTPECWTSCGALLWS